MTEGWWRASLPIAPVARYATAQTVPALRCGVRVGRGKYHVWPRGGVHAVKYAVIADRWATDCDAQGEWGKLVDVCGAAAAYACRK